MERRTDWLDWHRDYADPSSSLSRRRRVVQGYLRRILGELGGPARLLSICAGDGGDVLPVLAAQRFPVQALLVELDPELADRAREHASRSGLANVRVVAADAGRPAGYADALPVDVLLACGVFGNISEADVRRTVDALPGLLCPGGRVIWTRGRGVGDADASGFVRQLLAERGFTELDFTAPDDARFRVGLHRLDQTGSAVLPETLFRFHQD